MTSRMRDKGMAKVGNRKIEYEIIRVCAMIFMVTFHCRGSITGFIDTAGEKYLDDGLTLILLTTNSLFFMLSGKFALNTACETFSDYYDYYVKKLTNIVITVLLYMFLRSLYDNGGTFWQVSFWKTWVKNVFYEYAGKEYWFLYTLVGLLLLAPFLNKFVRDMKKGEIWLFLGIGLLYNSICTYAPYVNLSFSWQYIFGGWAYYFMLGYFLEKVIDTEKKKKIIYIIGVVCFIISFVQKQFGLVGNIHDLAPTFTMISCAMFLVLKREWRKENQFVRNCIIKLGKYSFGIYLVHNPVRYFLSERIPFAAEKFYLPNLLELTVCTIAVSFILSFLCENTLIRAAKWAVGAAAYPKKAVKRV